MLKIVPSGLDELVELLRGRKVAALTGAGCSTESGIPDYRGPKTRMKARNPVEYGQFLRDPEARQRYWARSAIGWPHFRAHEPNAAHYALAELEREGVIHGLITQNVDRLHTRAGSARVVELHGVLAQARCLECQALEERDALQARILNLNPGWQEQAPLEYAPDGDAELGADAERWRAFRVPACLKCGGVLKPDVVFFGENVPKAVVSRAWEILDEAQALLVVGSSLTVYSGYRFVKEANKRQLPVGLINLGQSRADDQVQVRVEAMASEALGLIRDALLGPAHGARS